MQWWRGGESTHLPPIWPEFDSQIRRHMWVEFVGSLLCTERFSPGTPDSTLLKNQHFTWFALIVNFSLQWDILFDIRYFHIPHNTLFLPPKKQWFVQNLVGKQKFITGNVKIAN